MCDIIPGCSKHDHARATGVELTVLCCCHMIFCDVFPIHGAGMGMAWPTGCQFDTPVLES